MTGTTSLRIVLLVTSGRVTHELASYCQRAFEALGHTARVIVHHDQRIARRLGSAGFLVSALEASVDRRRSLAGIVRCRPDLILVIKGECLPERLLGDLRARLGVPLANYWIDDPYYLDVSSRLSPMYDVFFTNAPQCVERHAAAGCRHAAFLSFGFDPHTHRRVDLAPGDREFFGSDVCFTGSLTRQRLQVLETLTNVNLRIWSSPEVQTLGPGYRITTEPVPPSHPLYAAFAGRPVWGEEMVKACSASKIVLNIHTQDAPTMRDFEAPACGALLLTDRVQGLSQFFEVGKEVVCFEDAADLRTRARYLLDHEEERLRIAEAGRRRVLRDHPYTERMKTVLSTLQPKFR